MLSSEAYRKIHSAETQPLTSATNNVIVPAQRSASLIQITEVPLGVDIV